MAGRRIVMRDYEFSLDPAALNWIRLRFATERNFVRRFTVQYEVIIAGTTYPVLRYDTAHGFAHRDILDWTGRVIDKTPIVGKTYNEAMTEAIADIKAHWPIYRATFEGMRPQ